MTFFVGAEEVAWRWRGDGEARGGELCGGGGAAVGRRGGGGAR
jgi:hypothetical protein